MAKNPKPIRTDAKRNAADRRAIGSDKPFMSRMTSNISGFKKDDVNKIGYMTNYFIRNTGLPSRTREFMLARNKSVVAGHHQMLDDMQADYLQGKADKNEWAKKSE